MAVDTRPGKAREKARQQKNLYKRRALDAEAKVARLEAANAAKDAALEGVKRRCTLAADWQDEVARRLAEDLLGVIARAALTDTGEGKVV